MIAEMSQVRNDVKSILAMLTSCQDLPLSPLISSDLLWSPSFQVRNDVKSILSILTSSVQQGAPSPTTPVVVASPSLRA